MIPNVMCIEDDVTTLMLFEFLFQEEKFCDNFIPIENGKQAYDYFVAQNSQTIELKIIPEIIFLDLNMPVMGGWVFIEEMESKFPEILNELNIIILSSSVNPKDQDLAFESPYILDFFDKPLLSSHLVQIKKLGIFKKYFS